MTTRVTDLFLTGTHAARPAESAVPVGALYSCTTHSLIYKNVAGTWTTWATLTSGSVAASAVTFSPTGAVAATDVQAAIAEVDTEKVAKSLFDANTILMATTDDTPVALTVAASRFVGRKATGDIDDMTAAEAWAVLAAGAGHPEVLMLAVSDETTAITTGTAKVTFRMPFAMTLTAVRASLTTASSSGTPTVDINEAGATILSTKLTIDASELTSTTAAAAAVISDANLADDAEMTIDIDTAGTGAKGLKVCLIGTRA